MNAKLALLLILLPHGLVASASSTPRALGPVTALSTAAVQESVDALIERGREALAAGRAAEAQKLFEQAAQQDKDSLRTRVWVIRAWLSQGRINDALDAIDALEKGGAKGAAIDYLYGMAFAFKARDYTASNVPGQITEMSFVDAVGYLERATAAEPELYRDAFGPLAEAAWHMQKLDVARGAAERALSLDPKSAEIAILLGKIAIAQFAAANTDESRKVEADKHWDAARAAFQKALDVLADAEKPSEHALEAQAANQLGHTYAWRQKLDEAAGAYALAAASDPTAVDFTQILGALGPEKFLVALETASKAYTVFHGATSTADAILLWWLGYARFQAKQYEGAEQAFTAAVAKAPAYFNSWWYVALGRYHRQDYAGAVATLRTHWEANPADLTASIETNRELNTSIVSYLVGWCAREKKNLDAGLLCEILAAVEPEKPDHWNNAGLFLRDAGEPLKASAKPEERKLALSYFEKAFLLYSKALQLEPENPGYLNDTAVMLHYYLDRDLEKALAMYKKATERAEAELKKSDLADDRREWFQIALRDSKNNAKLLEEQLAKR